MRFGFAGETATPILPIGVVGMPVFRVMSVQLSPPSGDFQSPLRPPPDCIPQGKRWNFYMAAQLMRGFVGSSEGSVAAVGSLRKSIRFNVLSPSVVRRDTSFEYASS